MAAIQTVAKILPLRSALTKNGYDYQMVARTSRAAIYQQTLEGLHVAYEVFEIKIQRERWFDGRLFPRKERFPGNEDFGKWAWTYPTLERALAKYSTLISRNDKD